MLIESAPSLKMTPAMPLEEDKMSEMVLVSLIFSTKEEIGESSISLRAEERDDKDVVEEAVVIGVETPETFELLLAL